MRKITKNVFYSIKFVLSRIKAYFYISIVSRVINLMDFFYLAFLTKNLMNSIVMSIQLGEFEKDILWCIAAICVSRIVIFAYNNITNYITSVSMIKHNDRFSYEIHQKLSSYPVEVLDNPQALSNIDQAIRDSQALLSCFNNALNVVFAIISAISIIYLSFSVDPYIALLTIAICVPSYFVNKKIKERNYDMEKRLNTSNRAANYFLRLFHVQLNNMEIKFYNLDDFIKRRYDSVKQEINKEKKSFIIKSNIVYFFTSSANSILGYIIKLLIIYKIIAQKLTVGDYSLFSSYIDKLQGSVSSIFTSINEINLESKKIDSFLSYYNLIIDSQTTPHKKLPSSKSFRISFENVSFKYPGTNNLILDNVSFSFDSCESVAFAGLNGAGKTTLIKLLLRYYLPTRGKITINDININEIDRDEYYKIFSVMFQDLTSYQISLADNIGISEINSVDINKVKNLLDQVELPDLKDCLHNTMGRDLDENGIVLSRGQLQKVNLAKALYKDARVYILDEPSASVDAVSEKMIFDKMLQLAKENRGLILISHRLSHLTKISKIVYLSNGRVLEIGFHEELMRNNGEYKRLFEMQKSAFN